MSVLDKTLCADHPLLDPAKDRLGYGLFAKYLTDSLYNMMPPEGLVLAIYGSWGSGKTSILNFIKYHIDQRPLDSRLIVVTFNPWWFSGHEDLLRRFFGQLQATLGGIKGVSETLREKLATYAGAISQLPVFEALIESKIAEFVPGLKHAKQAATAISELAKVKQQDINALKSEISGLLREQNRRILVIIDDIDRLVAEEIRQLFKVIKAVADFPNITYLLSFDKNVVASALSQVQNCAGESYLEKIVQVPFDLPQPSDQGLFGLLIDKLNEIIKSDPINTEYFSSLYTKGLKSLIRTPRDIVRFANSLSITYAVIGGEVNPVDFIAVEGLRLFCTEAYQIIRSNPEMFIRFRPTSDWHGKAGEHVRLFHEEWLKTLNDSVRLQVRGIVTLLFPDVGALYGSSPRASDSVVRQWRSELRICTMENFPIYFRLALPAGKLGNQELKNIFQISREGTEPLEKRLEPFLQERGSDGCSKIRSFLISIQDYTERDFPLDGIAHMIEVLLRLGDKISNADEHVNIFEGLNYIILGQVVFQLLHRLDSESRLSTMRNSIVRSVALQTIVAEVSVFGQQHGKFGGTATDEPVFSSTQLAELETAALSKIKEAAKSGMIYNVAALSPILQAWNEWGQPSDITSWLKDATVTDEQLVEFLELLAHKAYVQSSNQRRTREIVLVAVRAIQNFIDTEALYRRVKALLPLSIATSGQREAATAFIKSYEALRDGNDPDGLSVIMQDLKDTNQED